MPINYRSKFDEDGTKCRNDISYLRRHPECGVMFIQDKPFEPHHSDNKFKPFYRDFRVGIKPGEVPSVPDTDKPDIGKQPVEGGPVGPGVNAISDITDTYKVSGGGRRLVGEFEENFKQGFSQYRTLPTREPVGSTDYSIPRIGNTSYKNQPMNITKSKPIGDIEMIDFGAGVGNINEAPPTLEQTRLPPLRQLQGDPRMATEFNELNVSDLPPDVLENIAENIKVRDITPIRLLQAQGEQFENVKIDIEDETSIRKIIEKLELQKAQLDAMLKSPRLRSRTDPDELEGVESDLLGFKKQLKRIQTRDRFRKIFRLAKRDKPPKPRGMTDEEFIDYQIDQLTRNSTEAEKEQVARQLKRQGKQKITKPSEEVEGAELIAIEPISEEMVFLKQVEKLLSPKETELTIQQKENLEKELLSRGLSKERIRELLEKYEAYDPALAEAVKEKPRTAEERFLRNLRRGIRASTSADAPPVPRRQESIPLYEETPLTRGRTDLAPGRSRVEKAIDKIAGRLPEPARQFYKAQRLNLRDLQESLSARSIEMSNRINATRTRMFGQKFSRVEPVDLELQEVPRRNVTEEIPEIRPGDITEPDLDFSPFDESTFTRPRVKLSKQEFFSRVRAGAFSKGAAMGSAAGVGGVLAGFGIAEIMKSAGVENQYAVGATAGAGGGATARILTMAGNRALTRSATTAVAQTATRSAIRAGTSILRAGAEGAVVGLALMPIDQALNNVFLNAGMSHAGANVGSGLAVGGLATGITTIGLASLGAAPETLGLSLMVGAVAAGAGAIIGAIMGSEEDKEEARRKKEADDARDRLNSVSKARLELLKTLPKYDYDIDKAIDNWGDKKAIGLLDDTWQQFITTTRPIFRSRPENVKPKGPTDATGSDDEIKANKLFAKYIQHTLIDRVCKYGNTDCRGSPLEHSDPGQLKTSEVEFLDKLTNGTWLSMADMQVEMSAQELFYTRDRIGKAQQEMVNLWNEKQILPRDMDRYLRQTAEMDHTFAERFGRAIMLDAQQRIVDAYQNNQTKINQMSPNIRMAAIEGDPEFATMIEHYYETMETTSGQLSISVPQLIELQALPEEQQEERFEEIQFNNNKADPETVREAQELADEEDAVREAGFYDLDQAYLETDPTAIQNWHPSDSQILQAHSAGMNLNEYTDYMHELAKGEAGDFTKLPKYTDEQLRASGLLDYSHFQDELQLAGYRKDLYLYDPETRQFTLNPNVTNSAIPSTQNQFISQYTPGRLLQSRHEYANMVMGLNQSQQAEIDNYNNNLMKELSSYGKNYDALVAEYNNELLYQGRDDLLFFDVGAMYEKNKMEFNQIPISDKLKQYADNVDVTNKRQLSQKVNIKDKYALNSEEYSQVKTNLEDKGIVDPNQEQINTSVQEVTSS